LVYREYKGLGGTAKAKTAGKLRNPGFKKKNRRGTSTHRDGATLGRCTRNTRKVYSENQRGERKKGITPWGTKCSVGGGFTFLPNQGSKGTGGKDWQKKEPPGRSKRLQLTGAGRERQVKKKRTGRDVEPSSNR